MSTEPANLHPSAELLEAFLSHQVDAGVAARVGKHLESCTFCRELAEDLRGFDQLGEGDEPGEEHLEKSLGELRRRILVAEAEQVALAMPKKAEEPKEAIILPFVAAATSSPASLRNDGFSRRSFYSALAAAFVAALIGGSLAFERQQEVSRLEQKLAALDSANAELQAELKRPLANPQILELKPESGPLRGGDDTVPHGKALTVILQSNGTFPPGPWHATISTGGSSTLEIEDLKSDAGALVFFLPPGALQPGEYEISLKHEDGKIWPEVFPLPLGR